MKSNPSNSNLSNRWYSFVKGFQVLLTGGKCDIHFPCLLWYETNIKRMCRISAHPFYCLKKYFNSDIVRQVSQCYFAYRQSDIKTCGFSDILFALKLPKAISLGRSPNITAKQYNSPLANKTEAHFLTECASFRL